MNPKKGYFVLNVGTHRQIAEWSCGAAALKIVFDFYDKKLSEKEICKLAGTNAKNGTNPLGMIKAAKKLGFSVEDKQNLTESNVKDSIKSGVPIIANYQWKPKKGEGHYAVIIGFDNNNFILSDPAEDKGYSTVSISQFMKNWYELEDRTTREGIIISKKS